MPAVKFIERLDLEQNILFMNRYSSLDYDVMEFIFIVLLDGEMDSEDFACFFNGFTDCFTPVSVPDSQSQFRDDTFPCLFLDYRVYAAIPKYPYLLFHY